MNTLKPEDLARVNAYEVLMALADLQINGTFMSFNLDIGDNEEIPVTIAVAINENAYDLRDYVVSYSGFEDDDPPRLTPAEEGDLKRAFGSVEEYTGPEGEAL